MKNKLIELIQESVDGCAEYWAGRIADHLLANGVTIQRWIPVEERLPDVRGRYLISRSVKWLTNPIFEVADFANDLYEVDSYDFARMKGKGGFFSYDNEWGFFEIDSITHWMPLPKGPKEE